MTPAAPIEIQVKRHKCPGCKRSFSSRAYARAHVQNCQRIEENHGCKTCALFCPSSRPDPLDPLDQGEPANCSDGIELNDGLKVRCEAWEAIF